MRHRILQSPVYALMIFVIPLAPGLRDARGAYEPAKPTVVQGGNPYLQSLVRRAAAAMNRGDVEALGELAVEARKYEEENAVPLKGFQISDNLAELAAGAAKTRQERLDQREFAAQGADETVKVSLAWARDEDPWLKAGRLRGRRTWNNTAAFFNYLTESTSSLLAGNTRVIAQWILDLGQIWRAPMKLSPWRRQERALYERFVDRYPDDPNAPAARKRLEGLNKRVEDHAAKQLLKISKLHREAGHPAEALFYAKMAAEGGRRSSSAIMEAENLLTQPVRDSATVLSVTSGEAKTQGAERAALEKMLGLLAAGKLSELESEAGEFARKSPRSEFRDEALYLQCLAHGYLGAPGGRRQARQAMQEEAPGTNMALHAQNLERSHYTNPKAGYEIARAEHSRDKRNYILSASSSARDELEAARKGELPDTGAIDKITPVFVIDTALRAIKASLGAGPSNDGVREAAGRWVVGEPQSDEAKSRALWLADRARGEGNGDLAAEYLALAGKDSDTAIAKVRESQARDLYARVTQIEDPAEKEKALRVAQRELEGTRYEERVKASIAQLEKKQRLQLRKSELVVSPGLWRGRGLNLDPAWLDGVAENGEVADAGVTFFPPDFQEFEISYGVGGEERKERRRLGGRQYEEAKAALGERQIVETRYSVAQDQSRRHYFPVDIVGSAGASGLLVYPRLQPYQMDPKELPLYK